MGKRLSGRTVVPILLLVVLILTDRTRVVLLTLLAALLHECGHLLAAKLMRIPMRGVRFDLLGVRLEIGGRMLSYGEEWLLAAAGPLTSLLCAAVAALAWRVSLLFQIFSCASVVLGALNLLPIRTFDGGRMLECCLTAFWGVRVAQRGLAVTSVTFLFLVWAVSVYFLLRAGDGLALFCFSLSLFLRYFDGSKHGALS